MNNMATTTALETHGVCFGYDDRLLLKDISFAIGAGELVALIGPNGGGKTTLLKTLLGLLPPHTGSVALFGQSLANLKPITRAQTIAYVSQQPALSFPLTVRELVYLGRYPYGGRGKESPVDSRAVDAALERTAAAHLHGRRFNTLSGGEKQKVLIARALAQQARVILLDEPTLHLDLHFQLEILTGLRRLCIAEGITVVTVLHDINLAAQFADKALLLKNGVLHSFGAVSEVINVASIKELLDVEMTILTGNDQRTRYWVPIVRQVDALKRD